MSILLDNIYVTHWLTPCQKVEVIDINKNVGLVNSHYLFKIEDTIQYNALVTNNYNAYNEYISKTNQNEHSVSIFKQLLYDFTLEKIGKIKLEFVSSINKFLIRDGVHRISILFFKGLIKDYINLNLLEIKFDEQSIKNIKNILKKTTEGTFYNGWSNRTTFGYHSLNINNIQIPGQRQPLLRLNKIKKKIDFTNKIVIDFGCNIGGMLLHLPEIKEGYGLDYSNSCIDCGNKIRDILKYNNDLKFFVYDLNNLNVEEFFQTNNIKNIDIIFLLSLGSWVKNWKDLYTKSYQHSKNIILELNNEKEGEPQLELFKSLGATIELISDNSDDDISGNIGRKCYLIIKK
jgi:hypothetical protein